MLASCCDRSLASIRMSRGTGLLRLASQGLSHPFLKTFAAVFPDPTDRPWVCEDGIYPDFLKRYFQIDLFFKKKINQSIIYFNTLRQRAKKLVQNTNVYK